MEESFEVQLYIYDISNGMAKQFAPMVGIPLDGIWHTGIIVYGWEFFYGGGISYDVPGMTPFGAPTKKISLGKTAIPLDIFQTFLSDIAPRFTVDTYNILEHNCNNFTNECSNFLIGSGIPEEIVGLPQRVMATPFGMALRPMFDQMQRQMSSVQGSHGIGANASPLSASSSSSFPSTAPVSNPTLTQPSANNVQAQTITSDNISGGSHPHTKLSFQEIYKKKAYLFTVGNAKTILAKLKDNLKIIRSVSVEEEVLFEVLEKSMESFESIASATLPLNTFLALDAVWRIFPDDKVFPCLDIMRLLVLNASFREEFVKSDTLTLLHEKFHSGFNGPEQVMVLRLIANILDKCKIHSPEIETLFPRILDTALGAISVQQSHKQYSSLKIGSIAILYNISIQLDNSIDLEETGTQIISSLIHHLGSELEHENGYWMLMALGMLLFANDDGVLLAQTLTLDLSNLKSSKPSPKLSAVMSDVELLLRQ